MTKRQAKQLTRLVQCLANVLTNAAKYTDAGRTVHVQTRTDGSSAVIEIIGQADDRQRTELAGFDGHLIKPVDLTELKRAMAGLPQLIP